MNSEKIRQLFLEFFKSRGHAVVVSSSLIPDDPSVLLTTAGMQQFKRYFTGELDPFKDFQSKNTVSIQKCFRTSDIDEVGDESHLTFFEMLGNFSFGEYFKEKAIEYAHGFIAGKDWLNLPIDYVTVFGGDGEVPRDTESEKIWRSLGVKDIRPAGRADNFWGPTGKEGPCGPTTEVYVKNSAGQSVEIWNIVFNEYYKHADGRLEKLETPGVDTGMGLERLAMVVQKKPTIFETDLFNSILSSVVEIQGDIPINQIRLIADHLRGATFLIMDGVKPGKDERNYIVRRLIRRAMSAHYLYVGARLDSDFFKNSVNQIIDLYSADYPELKEKRDYILSVFKEEAQSFSEVLIKTVSDLKKIYNRFIAGIDPEKKLPEMIIKDNIVDVDGEVLFRIRETHGVGLEIMKAVMEKWGLIFSQKTMDKYNEAYKKHQEISRAGQEKKFGGHGLILDTGELKAGNEAELQKVTRLHTATHLLNQALREVLGNEVAQRGSDITVERTRFDFTFPRKMTPEEIKKAEEIVNGKIQEDLPVGFEEMDKEEAEKTGALHFFKAKYPPRVKVYYVGHSLKGAWSKEFCGGPHVTRTGEIGKFKIIKEEASSAGVRRLRAIIE